MLDVRRRQFITLVAGAATMGRVRENGMKMIVFFAVATLLLAVTEASAQSRPGTRCPNGGYRGSIWCCNVNAPRCLARAERVRARESLTGQR
jgi:hypothetical protein